MVGLNRPLVGWRACPTLLSRAVPVRSHPRVSELSGMPATDSTTPTSHYPRRREFKEILARFPKEEITGPPEPLRSTQITGIPSLRGRPGRFSSGR